MTNIVLRIFSCFLIFSATSCSVLNPYGVFGGKTAEQSSEISASSTVPGSFVASGGKVSEIIPQGENPTDEQLRLAMTIASVVCVQKAREIATEEDSRPLGAVNYACLPLQERISNKIYAEHRVPSEEELKVIAVNSFEAWWNQRRLDTTPYNVEIQK